MRSDSSVNKMVGMNIRRRRTELDMSQEELAQRCGYKSKSSINKIEAGVQSLTQSKIATLARALDTTPGYILGWQEEEELVADIERNERPDFQSVPILGSVAAGYPREMFEDVLGWEQIDYDLAETGRLFALRIGGDSMEPEIKKGSVAIVRMQKDVDSGDVAIVKINGDEATCKRVQKTDDGVMLVPSNPAYPPKYFSSKEMKDMPVSIIGRVMEVRTRF